MPISAVHHNKPVTHIYTFCFPYYLPSWSSPRDSGSLCYTLGPTSLLIHSEGNSWHWPSPISQSIPLWSHLIISFVNTTNSFHNHHQLFSSFFILAIKSIRVPFSGFGNIPAQIFSFWVTSSMIDVFLKMDVWILEINLNGISGLYFWSH